MNRISTWIILCLAFGLSLNLSAQSAANYSFSASSGTFTAISGTDTASEIHADSRLSDPIPIGFSFTYEGTSYTYLKASSNGFIQLDTTQTSSRTTNDLDGVNEPIIAPLWDDNDGRATGGSYASYVVTGTAPNRVFTFEWLNWEWRYNSSSPTVSFQVKLFETSNKIEFIYRPESGTVSSGTASVGLCGAGTGSGTFISIDGLSTSSTASTTTETTNISTKPASGLTYTFTPPSCLAPTNVRDTNTTTTAADILFNSAATAGSTYYVEYGLKGGSTTNTISGTTSSGTTTASLSSLTASSLYVAKVRVVCGAGDTSNWTSVEFNTACAAFTAPYTQNFDLYSSGEVPVCWTAYDSTSSSFSVSEVYTTNYSSPNGYRLYNSSGSGGNLGVVTPEFSDLTTKQNRITFYMRNSSTSAPTSLVIGTVSHPDSLSTFAPFDTIDDADITSSWTKYEVKFDSSYTQNHKYIYLMHDMASTYDYLYIDDFEYSKLPQNDAGVEGLVESTFCPGSTPVKAIIKNHGIINLTSATVNWTVAVNSGSPVAQTPFSYTGSLNRGDTAHVNLGNYSFSAGNTYDIVVYTSSPNSTTDDNNLNDTISLTNLGTALSGTYTLGGTSPDFANFAALDTALNNRGLCGATRILVRQGTYNEQIKFSNIGGLSSTNTLEIVADPANTAAATLTHGASGTGDNFTVAFDGASYITIDSLNLAATGTSYGRVVTFEGMNNNITLSNNTITGVSVTSTSSLTAVIYDNSGTANVNENLTITGNVIQNGSYGVYLYGIGSTSFENGLKFQNNEVKDFHYYGIYSYYQSNAVFSGNYIKDSDTYTSPYGMRIYYNDTVTVYNNEVYVGGTSSPYGIYLYYCDGNSTKPVTVYNNMVGMYNSTATGTVNGLYAYQGEENKIYYNSISVQGGSSSARAFYFSYSTGDNAEVKNNTFSNFGGGYAVYASTNSGLSSSDYNNLYSSTGDVGYWSGAQSSLSDYQTASSMESNSVSANPVHFGTMDLRAKGTALNGAANPISGYTTDLFGTTRNSTTPDIGAHEFTPPANDVGITAIVSPKDGDCGSANHSVTVKIKNYGTASQSSIPVTVVVSGSISTTLNATFGGTLASGADTNFIVGTIATSTGGTINITSYSTHTGDADSDNDTSSLSGISINSVPGSPSSSNATVCAGSDTNLIATGSASNFKWYDAATGGTVLASNDTFSITNATATDTFYVAQFNSATNKFGPTKSIGSSSNFTSVTAQRLIFTANNAFTLDSVTVYPDGAGTITIEAKNSSGTVIASKVVTVSATGGNPEQVYLGFNIPVGVGHTLGASATTTGGLIRNSTGAVYPYTDASGSVSITGNSFSSSYYYFFYEWVVTVDGCESPRTPVVLNVNPLPTVNLGPDTAFCGGSSFSYTLDATTTGGSYKWQDNSTNATYTATVSGTYWCEVTVNGCSAADTVQVGANPLPTVNFPNPSDVCENDTILTLSGATPTGGTYSGTNVSNNEFDPSAAGAGTDTLYYTFTDSIGCSASDTAYINVLAKPSVSLTSLNSVCENGSPVTLSGGMPTGGTYSGTGVSTGIFFPDSAGAGSHTITYMFTATNGCSDTATQSQVVDTVPVVSFSMQSNWCLNAAPVQLSGGMPMGGTYAVNGSMDTVYQSMTAGMDTVVYTFTDSNNCSSTDTAYVMADTVPVVTFGSIADVCVGSGSVTLNTGMPSGGMYMGNNVSGSAYNPSMVGTDTLTYVFVDSNSCSDTITQTITVNALPTVALGNLTDVCENTPAFALSGGTPAGGMYSGNNVSGGSFDPGAAGTGSTTITYTYTDGNSCTDSAQNTIMVNTVTAAVFNYIGHSCNNHDPINLATYASPAGGTFSGGSVSGNNFDPSAAGTGVHTVSYTFTNSNNCSDSASRTITVEAAPVFTMVGVKTNGCNNDPAVITTSLSGSSGYTYHWKDGSKGDTAYVRQNGDVWVQVTDGSTIRLCASTDTIKGITYEEICVGLDEALSGTSINYFPNPSNGNFSYQLEGFDGLDVEVTIVNANGQVVYNTTWTEVSNFHTGEINLTDVESGLYFINLSTEKGNVMHRITVTK